MSCTADVAEVSRQKKIFNSGDVASVGSFYQDEARRQALKGNVLVHSTDPNKSFIMDSRGKKYPMGEPPPFMEENGHIPDSELPITFNLGGVVVPPHICIVVVTSSMEWWEHVQPNIDTELKKLGLSYNVLAGLFGGELPIDHAMSTYTTSSGHSGPLNDFRSGEFPLTLQLHLSLAPFFERCEAHHECPQGSFCHNGACDSCEQCHLCHDGVDGTCGHCGSGYPTDEEPESAMCVGGGSHEQAAQAMTAALMQLEGEGKPRRDLESVAQLIMLLGVATDCDGWACLVGTLLERTGDIHPEVTLGSAATNAWARGKDLIWATTLPTPNENAKGLEAVHVHQVFCEVGMGHVDYTVSQNASAPERLVSDTLPAKFSVRVHEEEGGAPQPFCGDPDCFGALLSYRGGDLYNAVHNSTPLGSIFHQSFEARSSRLPLSYVAAASSAYGWRKGVMGFDGSTKCFDHAVWAQRAMEEDGAFEGAAQARAQIFEEVVASTVHEHPSQDLAELGLFALGDGASTDYLGVAHAIAAGATEVTLLSVRDERSSIVEKGTVDFPELAYFLGGSGDPTKVVFSSPSADDLRSLSWEAMEAPAQSRFFFGVQYSRVECVTAKNLWFNILAGKRVALNWIVLGTNDVAATILKEKWDFYIYGDLVDEIVRTIADPANEQHAKTLLKDYFGVE